MLDESLENKHGKKQFETIEIFSHEELKKANKLRNMLFLNMFLKEF